MKYLIGLALAVAGVFLIHWGLDAPMFTSTWQDMAHFGALMVGVTMIVFGGIAAFAPEPGAPITLDSNEWVATEWREEEYTVPLVVGKVIIPQRRIRQVPIVYRRRGTKQ